MTFKKCGTWEGYKVLGRFSIQLKCRCSLYQMNEKTSVIIFRVDSIVRSIESWTIYIPKHRPVLKRKRRGLVSRGSPTRARVFCISVKLVVSFTPRSKFGWAPRISAKDSLLSSSYMFCYFSLLVNGKYMETRSEYLGPTKAKLLIVTL